MTDTLKPCPFCGGEPYLRKNMDPDGFGDFYAYKCRDCGAQAREQHAVEACPVFFGQCRDAWNTRVAPKVKPLAWLERRNNMLEAGPYQVCLNGSASDPDAMWRVRFHGRVICKQIKGVDRACDWANTHHAKAIFSALVEV